MGLVVWVLSIWLIVLHLRSGCIIISLLHAAALVGWQVLISLIATGSQAAADMWVWLAVAGLAASALAVPLRRASTSRSYRRAVAREARWQSDVHNRMTGGH